MLKLAGMTRGFTTNLATYLLFRSLRGFFFSAEGVHAAGFGGRHYSLNAREKKLIAFSKLEVVYKLATVLTFQEN